MNLATLHTFEQKLDLWFHRSDIPIWISEYGFQTRPWRRGGVTVRQQAAYVRQSLAIAAAEPRVQMYIWFTFRDDPAASTWDSGLIADTGAYKPAFAVFAETAAPLDARNPKIGVRADTARPVLTIPVWELAIRDGIGGRIGAVISVYSGRRRVGRATPEARITVDGYAAFPLPIRRIAPGARYRVYLRSINDIHGNRISRMASWSGYRASTGRARTAAAAGLSLPRRRCRAGGRSRGRGRRG